jgi:TrmH family RNA methyltransferase
MTQAELKRVRALHQKKFREETGTFLVQGRKVVAELLRSRYRAERVFAAESAARFIEPLTSKRRVPLHVLPEHELERLGTFEKGNELVAVARTPEAPGFRAPAADELMMAFDGVADPRNMGGLLRIADWFGIARVLCSPDCMEVFNPKCVQSTMGSLFRVEVRYAPLAEELTSCARAGCQVYLADMSGTPAFSVALSRPAILVLGSESHGLSDALRKIYATTVCVPRVGKAESLNVAMAASALCLEFTRQFAVARA